MLFSKLTKNNHLDIKSLELVTFVNLDNIKNLFKRDTIFYVIQPHSGKIFTMVNHFQIRDRFVSGWNKITMYQCGQLVTFNINSVGESEDEWNEWFNSMKHTMKEMIKRKELYCETIK